MKILHLYYDLMNLYGDWANADILARALRTRGVISEIDKKSVGDDIDLGIYDFVYIGSGTERSQRACMRDLLRQKDALLERIESGLYVLATGNSHELFGSSVTAVDGECFEALGLLDFETVQERTRVPGDVVCSVSFLEEKLIGFINRAGGRQTDNGAIERPFACIKGPVAYGEGRRRSEGIRYNNLLGTYLTGPILVRNPPLLRYFADALTGGATTPNSGEDSLLFTLQEETYHKALGELLS